MTTQPHTIAPPDFATREFNEGMQFFLMNIRLNLDTAVEMAEDEIHRTMAFDARSLFLLTGVVRTAMQLLEVCEEHIPK